MSVFDKYKNKSGVTDMAETPKKPEKQPPQPKPSNLHPTTPLPVREDADAPTPPPLMPGQVTVEAKEQYKPVLHMYDTESEHYLRERGWKKVSLNEQGLALWDDPMACNLKAEMQHTCTLPTVGGGKEHIKQCVLPPSRWMYQTNEAVRVQYDRDRHGESLKDIIARKELELEQLKLKLASQALPKAG